MSTSVSGSSSASPGSPPQQSDIEDPSKGPTPSPDTLVRYLLNAKRSLTSINHVSRANELCTSTRRALESSAVNLARSSFLRSGIAAQLDVLGSVHLKTRGIADAGKTDFQVVVRDLDEANERLKDTLQKLRNTVVEAKLRPEGEERRNLLTFVDEKSVDEALAETKKVIHTAGREIAGFEKECKSFEEGLGSIRTLLTKDVKVDAEKDDNSSRSLLPEILHEMDEHARDMAVNLESLVSHFDLCVTAIKHVEGGGDAASKIAGDLPEGVNFGTQDTQPVSEEEKSHMMAVLQEDAGQVDEVVLEIRQRISLMETLDERVKDLVALSERRHANALTAFRLLESIGQSMPSYLSQNQIFLTRWTEEKARIAEKLEELEGLCDFYEGFLRAYDNLLIEIGRRKSLEMRMDKVVQEAMARIEKLYADDMEEREAFKKEQGDFLPVDIWPGLMNAPLRYYVFPDEDTVEKVPDISASVIHRAIRRVHGER